MSNALISLKDATELFPVLTTGGEQQQILKDNLAGESVGVGDLARVKVPAGGVTSFTIPSIAGDKTTKEIEGVIIHVARRRAYWENPNPSNEQPDCSSNDCINGVGNPGGDCATCPMNEFGTALKQGGGQGRGKACKESTLLFMLTPGSTMPIVVVCPPGSLKAVRQYRLNLNCAYFACVTKLELEKVPNKDGIPFARIVPKFVSELDPSAVVQVKQYAANLIGVFNSETVKHTDVEGDAE